MWSLWIIFVVSFVATKDAVNWKSAYDQIPGDMEDNQ